MSFLSPPKRKPIPVAPPAGTDDKQERLRRAGRASLISSSQRGVLGGATTNRKQLTAF